MSFIVFVRCKGGKAIGFEPSSQENRPQLNYERILEYNFSAASLIQIFEHHLVCVLYEEGKSHLTVPKIHAEMFLILLDIFD